MSYALSNPYTITCGDITVKCSPFTGGWFIADQDLVVANRTEIIKALTEEYDIEQSPEILGIKVFKREPKEEQENVEANVEIKEQIEEQLVRDSVREEISDARPESRSECESESNTASQEGKSIPKYSK